MFFFLLVSFFLFFPYVIPSCVTCIHVSRLVRWSWLLFKYDSPVQADVRKPEDLEKAVAKTVEKYGHIDFLINGAAGNFLAPFDSLSYNAFRTVIEIDLLGSYNLTKAALQHLRASNGAIINVSATLHYTGTIFQQHAGAAKAGIDVSFLS